MVKRLAKAVIIPSDNSGPQVKYGRYELASLARGAHKDGWINAEN
jgi:hypothetical protein